MFRGRYEHAIDAKGRTSVPARFRDELSPKREQAGASLVLTCGLEPCVVAYPMREWLAFEERLARLPQFDPSVAMIRRLYVSGAVECDVDRLGRVLVPAALREHAGLRRQALWTGMGRHVELWSKERFESLRDGALESDERRLEIAKRLAELGL